MNVTVRLFAAARQLAGAESIDVPCPPSTTVAELKQVLSERLPELKNLLAQTRCAVESVYVTDDTVLQDGQEVACIPPVSGG